MAERTRLDQMLVERGFFASREQARRAVMAGWVLVEGTRVDKAGTRVRGDERVDVLERPRYVGRGGLKLEKALDEFGIDPAGFVCADIGASTGGFTDCLLQRGAAKVYAIDVGYGQLDWRLRKDARVVVMERTNARRLRGVYASSDEGISGATAGRQPPVDVPEGIDLVVADVSFISLRKVAPAMRGLLVPDGNVVTLIKPQFEIGADRVGKGGVVREARLHMEVLQSVLDALGQVGLPCAGLTFSPTRGAKGNIEFLARLKRAKRDADAAATNLLPRIETVVTRAHEELDAN